MCGGKLTLHKTLNITSPQAIKGVAASCCGDAFLWKGEKNIWRKGISGHQKI